MNDWLVLKLKESPFILLPVIVKTIVPNVTLLNNDAIGVVFINVAVSSTGYLVPAITPVASIVTLYVPLARVEVVKSNSTSPSYICNSVHVFS